MLKSLRTSEENIKKKLEGREQVPTLPTKRWLDMCLCGERDYDNAIRYIAWLQPRGVFSL